MILINDQLWKRAECHISQIITSLNMNQYWSYYDLKCTSLEVLNIFRSLDYEHKLHMLIYNLWKIRITIYIQFANYSIKYQEFWDDITETIISS